VALSIRQLSFTDRFVRGLPGDPRSDNRVRQVHEACYSRVEPTPVPAPEILVVVPEVAALLDLDPRPTAELADVLAGNRVLPGMTPYAACYGGHQFGTWAGQLGDGRAITLAEVENARGETWEIQLKGAGPTPYSRTADGRAVLRSSLRELVCSEAMHHLGVPTTRALSLVMTGQPVMRDLLYDGHPAAEPGAIVCRVAPTFLRFGSYEIHRSRDDEATLRRLVQFTLERYYPQYIQAGELDIAGFFDEVAQRTAWLLAEWMRVGFVHGVMNTDNMSILGLTIDYGPYGWIDDYDPDWTPNTTDAGTRRYRFGNQPRIAAWNLVKLAGALHPLIGEAGPLEDGMQVYAEVLERESLASFAAKLGLASVADDLCVELVNGCLRVLAAAPTDMTIFHRALADVPVDADASDEQLLAPLQPAYYVDTLPPAAEAATLSWLRRLGERVRAEHRDPAKRRAQMHAANPKYVLRNYLAQEAITAAEQGDPSLIHELLDVMRQPYAEQPGRERFAARRPEWARQRPGCSMLSCSS
jgi:serine/tyrosine/threonine adenylyltransferase